jgi:hypothetical protein
LSNTGLSILLEDVALDLNKNEQIHQIIGEIPKIVLELLRLDLPTTTVKITNGAIKHVQNDHPIDFSLYFSHLKEIIEKPDFAGAYRGQNKFELIKILDDHVLVGLKVHGSHVTISSFYRVNWVKVDTRIKRGRLKKIVWEDD